MEPGSTLRVTAVAVVRDADRAALPTLIDELRAQRGVACERVLIDATGLGDLRAPASIRVVRPERHSVARALRALGGHSDLVVPFVPGAHSSRDRVARLAEAFASDPAPQALAHGASHGPDVIRPADDPRHPGPSYAACVGLRGSALADLDPRAFRPCLLELLRAIAGAGQLGSLDAALTELPVNGLHEASRSAAAEARWLELEAAPAPEVLPATVILAHHRRPDAIFECLAALACQTVGPRAFDVVVCDDASSPEEVAALRTLEPPMGLTVVHQPGGGATNARNLGLPHVRGELLVMINDDSIGDPDLIERHLAAHGEYDQPVCVLGNFRQTELEQRTAVVGALERTTHMFAFSALEPGQVCSGGMLYTCNASVRTEIVRALNGFDGDFTLYAEDTELGIRLEEAGVPIVYRPECGAIHRHRIDTTHVERRYPAVGLAHARLFRAQPRSYEPWENIGRTEEREFREAFASTAALHEPLERNLHGLGNIDLGALRDAGEATAELADELDRAFESVLRRALSPLWMRGFLEGFEAFGAHGFGEYLATRPFVARGAVGPFAILRVRARGRRWLELAERWYARDQGDATLCLWTDASDGLDAGTIEARLAPLRARVAASGLPLRDALLSTALPRGWHPRVMAIAEHWIPSEDEQDVDDAECAAQAGIEELDTRPWTALLEQTGVATPPPLPRLELDEPPPRVPDNGLRERMAAEGLA